MKQCWPEGALRAYLDGELAPDDMQSVSAHLKECAACDGVCAELSVRAAQVSGLMEALAEPAAQVTHRRTPVRVSGSWAWTGAAVALAAGLAIAALVVPKHEPAKTAEAPVVETQPREQQAQIAVPVTATPREVAVMTPKPRRAQRMDSFIALDDEPIESGIVMRVTVPGSTPADILFSPDGRARAIRLVNGSQRTY